MPILSLLFFVILSGCARAPVKIKKETTLPPVKIEKETALPEEMSSIGNSRAYAHYLMGLIYDNQGKLEEALGEYEKALEFDPHSSTILISLGKYYLRRGMVDESRQKLRQAVQFDPDNEDAHLLLALICELQEDIEGAAKHYEDVLRLTPQDVDTYHRLIALRLLLSAIYEEAGKLKEACSQLKEALRADPDNDLAHFYLGANLDKQSRMEEAISELKKAIQLNPKNAEALNYLGYLYADKGINLGKSIQLIKRALELKPDSGYIVDSLGWAYFKKGMIEEALAELQRAVELTKANDEDDPIIRDHLGDAYLRKGMVREAIEQWEKSLELDSANQEVKTKLKRARESLEASEFENSDAD